MPEIEVVTVIEWKWHRGYPGGEGSGQSVLEGGLPSADGVLEALKAFWTVPPGKTATFEAMPWSADSQPSEGFIEVGVRRDDGLDDGTRALQVSYEVKAALRIEGRIYGLVPLE